MDKTHSGEETEEVKIRETQKRERGRAEGKTNGERQKARQTAMKLKMRYMYERVTKIEKKGE